MQIVSLLLALPLKSLTAQPASTLQQSPNHRDFPPGLTNASYCLLDIFSLVSQLWQFGWVISWELATNLWRDICFHLLSFEGKSYSVSVCNMQNLKFSTEIIKWSISDMLNVPKKKKIIFLHKLKSKASKAGMEIGESCSHEKACRPIPFTVMFLGLPVSLENSWFHFLIHTGLSGIKQCIRVCTLAFHSPNM